MKSISRLIVTVLATLALVSVYQNCGTIEAPLATDLSSSNLLPFSNLQAPHHPKEILVRMNTLTGDQDLRNWAIGAGLTLENEWPSQNTTHWSWVADKNVNEVEVDLGGQGFSADIKWTEPNYIYTQPPDEILTLQTFSDTEVVNVLAAPGDNSQTSAPIGATNVWNLPNNAPPVVVAVIDTGVQVDHPAFVNAGAIWQNPGEVPNNGIDDDNNGFVDDVNGWDFLNGDPNPDDQNGHGTHCAGVVLGVGQDLFDNTPPQARIRIMGLKFLGATGQGDTAGGISAIYYAANNGASVISNSWGGGGASRALEEAMAYAYGRGLSIVSAAGNSNSNNDISAIYPANFLVPSGLTVLATTDADAKANFSNFGNSSVNIAAPGVSILSTYPTSRYARLSGTSMATPFVAGTAALMKYTRPAMNGFEIRNVLRNEADNVGGLNGFVRDRIRLNSDAAVNVADSTLLNGTQPAYSLSSRSRSDDSGGGGGGCGRIEGPPPGGPGSGLFLALLLLPLLILTRLKTGEFAH